MKGRLGVGCPEGKRSIGAGQLYFRGVRLAAARECDKRRKTITKTPRPISRNVVVHRHSASTSPRTSLAVGPCPEHPAPLEHQSDMDGFHGGPLFWVDIIRPTATGRIFSSSWSGDSLDGKGGKGSKPMQVSDVFFDLDIFDMHECRSSPQLARALMPSRQHPILQEGGGM
jgi:hypothetical protein